MMWCDRFLPRTLISGATVGCVLLVASSTGVVSTAQAQSIDDYFLDRTFSLPASFNGTGDFDDNVLFTDLPDGRLLLVNGPGISVETGVGTGTFTNIGDYTTNAPTFGPTIAAVSPDGTRVAIGSNGGGSIFVADTVAPTPGTTQAFDAADFAGVWLDNDRLLISNFNGVDLLDTTQPTNAAVTNIVTNIGGASAGITLDSSGNLYTGNGFDFATGGSNTGSIKVFVAADIQAAITSGTAIDFENSGIEVADLLSASTLGFDGFGNFFVGGGDLFGGSDDVGYAGLIAAAAIADRLADPINVPLIDLNSDPSILRMFETPQNFIDAQQSPGWVYNDFTGELLLGYFEQSEVFAFAIPEPATAGLLALGLTLGLTRRRTS